MKIRPFIGVTSLAAMITLVGMGCSSSPDPTDPSGDAAPNDTGVAHDGAAPKDTGTPEVDGGVDAQILVDGGPLSDAADSAPPENDGGTDAATDAAHDGSTPSDAGQDASTTPSDAGSDTSAPPPSDAGDAGDDGSAAVCAPADESAFAPTWHGSNAHTPSCTQAQMDAYLQCILDGETQASPASCAPFAGTNITAANKACVSCILTQDTAASYGAIIVHKGTIEMNQPGCLAIATNDPQGTGCAGHLQAANQCRNAACAASCPVVDDATFTAEQQCEQAAGTGTCKTEADAATCTDALVEAGGGPAACMNGQTFADIYNAITPIFCGAP